VSGPTPLPPEAESAQPGFTARIKALICEYDEKWSALDVPGVAGLWERDTPQPIYLGDEYAMPLVGAEALERHWARMAARCKRASVTSQLWSAEVLADGLARCILLSRWTFTGSESEIAHTGASWITWLLTLRGNRYLIVHHMESQVYLGDGFGPGAAPGPDAQPAQ
jgi:ketosteroid isomerase-like protein